MGNYNVQEGNGAPEEIRTPNLLIRSQMLYPIELRARIGAGLAGLGRCAGSSGG